MKVAASLDVLYGSLEWREVLYFKKFSFLGVRQHEHSVYSSCGRRFSMI